MTASSDRFVPWNFVARRSRFYRTAGRGQFRGDRLQCELTRGAHVRPGRRIARYLEFLDEQLRSSRKRRHHTTATGADVRRLRAPRIDAGVTGAKFQPIDVDGLRGNARDVELND